MIPLRAGGSGPVIGDLSSIPQLVDLAVCEAPDLLLLVRMTEEYESPPGMGPRSIAFEVGATYLIRYALTVGQTGITIRALFDALIEFGTSVAALNASDWSDAETLGIIHCAPAASAFNDDGAASAEFLYVVTVTDPAVRAIRYGVRARQVEEVQSNLDSVGPYPAATHAEIWRIGAPGVLPSGIPPSLLNLVPPQVV